MLSDLTSTVLLAAVALVLVGAWFFLTGRRAAAASVRRSSIFGLPTVRLRASSEAWIRGHQAAAPFLERYGRLILTCTVVVVLTALLDDWLGAFFYLVTVALVVLGFVVCIRKAHAAVGAPLVAEDPFEQSH